MAIYSEKEHGNKQCGFCSKRPVILYRTALGEICTCLPCTLHFIRMLTEDVCELLTGKRH